MGGVAGLDYGAVIQFAQLTPLSAEASDLLAGVLPAVEIAILKGFKKEDDE